METVGSCYMRYVKGHGNCGFFTTCGMSRIMEIVDFLPHAVCKGSWKLWVSCHMQYVKSYYSFVCRVRPTGFGKALNNYLTN